MNRWINKYRYALRGIAQAVPSQTSFWIHLPCAALVIALAIILRAEAWQWAALATAIGIVLIAEMFNTALELIVRVLHPEQNPLIGVALDVAAGAVLVAAVTAFAIGVATLGPDLHAWLF